MLHRLVTKVPAISVTKKALSRNGKGFTIIIALNLKLSTELFYAVAPPKPSCLESLLPGT